MRQRGVQVRLVAATFDPTVQIGGHQEVHLFGGSLGFETNQTTQLFDLYRV